MTHHTNDELEEILYKYISGEDAPIIVGEMAQAIKDYIDAQIKAEKDERIKRNKSLCGCMFCTHHSEPYETHIATIKSKGSPNE